jgi:hypothetical protein
MKSKQHYCRYQIPAQTNCKHGLVIFWDKGTAMLCSFGHEPDQLTLNVKKMWLNKKPFRFFTGMVFY